MPTISLSTGAQFTAETGQSILDAAMRAGVQLAYSCKTGRCSSCKCKVTQGTTSARHPETGLSDQEKSDGWILGCVRSALTDVVIEADDLGGINLPPARTWPCRINSIEPLAADVLRITLRLPPTADFLFLPGQYIDVIGHDGVRRSYSLANSTADEKQLELHVRAVDGGEMSRYWFGLAKPNDLLRLNGPQGTFFLRGVTQKHLIFLATGTGIAPVVSMLNSIVNMPREEPPLSVTLVWGGRRRQDLYLDAAYLNALSRFVPVLSRPDDSWRGATGRVQDALLDLQPDLQNAVVYACGSSAMIHDAHKALTTAGLSSHHFFSDAFVRSGML